MDNCANRENILKEPDIGDLEAENDMSIPNHKTNIPEDVPVEGKFALSIDPHADERNKPPCYLPQKGDEGRTHELEPMGPIGPWATGKVDWSPLGGLTGTRPVVDQYSITRFSPNEWRMRNWETLKNTRGTFDNVVKDAYNSKTTLMRINGLVSNTQRETSTKLQQRTHLVGKWKNTLEDAIIAMCDELSTMEAERVRLKKSMLVLGLPESIVKKCIEKRSGRQGPELVRDEPEEQLINELALIAELRQLWQKTYEDVIQQQIENTAARERLEYDWSDKVEAYDIDTVNIGLNNNSKTILFRPGAVRQPSEQASEQYWEHFTTETLGECEKTRQKSIKLRESLNAILLNAARDLRSQADIVEKALVARINCTQEIVLRFENDLRECLQKLADTEIRIDDLRRTIRSYDGAMKVAQTRMYNRSYRPNVESCRDKAQQDLINEVGTIQSCVTAIMDDLNTAEQLRRDLILARGNLEREIMLKRHTLFIDRDRCMLLRTHYPSAAALSGFVDM